MTKSDYIGGCLVKEGKEKIWTNVWVHSYEEVKKCLRCSSSLPDFYKVMPFKKKDNNNVGPLIGLQNLTLEELMDGFEIGGGYVTPLALALGLSHLSQRPISSFLYLIEKGENQFCLSLCVDLKESIKQIKELFENNGVITNMSKDEIQELLNTLQDYKEEFLLQAYPTNAEQLPTGHYSVLKEIITHVPEEEANFEELKKIAEDVIVEMNAICGLTIRGV